MSEQTTTTIAAPTLKVDLLTALADFERMCKARRLSLDESDFSPAERAWWTATRQQICRLISIGEVVINADNDPVFSFGNPPIKLGKATGAALLAQDGKQGNAFIFAALAAISGMDVVHFANLPLHDIHILKTFYVLFFQHG